MSESKRVAPKIGSFWRFTKDPVVCADDALTRVRVMAVVEGYVVARRTGSMPFLKSARDWVDDMEPYRRRATLSTATGDTHV